MGEEKIDRPSSRSATQANHVGGSAKEDRGIPACKMGEGEGSTEEGGISGPQASLVTCQG
jgi:hypothetical protein